MYRIEFSHDAAKALAKMPKQTARLIRAKLDLVAADPHAKHPQVKPLRGSAQGAYRLRVGDWRAVYEIEDDRLVIVVIRVAHRREVYR